MGHKRAASWALAVMALAGCAAGADAPRRVDLTAKQAAEVQARVETYLYSSVVPRLRPCWAALDGRGSVRVTHEYARENATWLARRVVLDDSSLPDGVATAALACLAQAQAGTSFAAGDRDAAQARLVLRWTWPVPLPQSGDVARYSAARLLGNGAGDLGCDGRGTPAGCTTCVAQSCVAVCIGYRECTLKAGGCEAVGDCVTGRTFAGPGIFID